MGIQNFFARLLGPTNRAARRRSKTPPLPRPAAAPTLPPLYFETLEPRLLLSASPFIYDASLRGAQDLTLSLVDLIGGTTIRLTDNTTGTILGQALVADTTNVAITLSSSNDRLVLDGLFKGLVPVSIVGGLGTDTLESGRSAAFAITGTDQGVLLGANFLWMERALGSALNDSFTLVPGGSMSAGIDGAGGSDTMTLAGLASSVGFAATTTSTASITMVGSVTSTANVANIESFFDKTTATALSLTGSAFGEAMTLSQTGGYLTLDFGLGMTYTTGAQTGSFTINEGGGLGQVAIVSGISLPDATLSVTAERIYVGAVTIDTRGVAGDGSVSLTAVGTAQKVSGAIHGFSGIIAQSAAVVEATEASIASGAVTISATSTVSQAIKSATLSLMGLDTSARVSLVSTNLLATKGAVTVLATTTNTASATTTVAVKSALTPTLDAGLAYVQLNHTALVEFTDVSASAATNIDVRARQTDSLTATVEGGGDTGLGSGAVAAAAIVTGQTAVTVQGTGSYVAGRLAIFDATSDLASTVAVKATAGGTASSGGTNATEKDLAASGARTGDGAVTLAAAFAWNSATMTTQMAMTGNQSIDAGAIFLRGNDSQRLSASADASFARGDIAAAVALNTLSAHGAVQLGGAITAPRGVVSVLAGEAGKLGSLTNAQALSGASGGKGFGLAGAVALNDVTHLRSIDQGAFLWAKGGDLSILITGTASDTAVAASGLVGTSSVGIGASAAMNLLDRDANLYEHFGAASVSSTGSVTHSARTQGNVVTTATAGAAGGTALTPAFALSLLDNDVTIFLDGGSQDSGPGTVSLTAERLETVATSATGTTRGTTAAIGASVALTVGLQDVVAVIAREVAAHQVTVTARQRIDATTQATAAVTGSRAARAGDTADVQTSRATTFASNEAGSAVSAPDVDTPQGDFGLAAALGLSLMQGTTSTQAGELVESDLPFDIHAITDIDSAVTADGSVVTASAATMPNVGIGAAVALNLAQTRSQALVNGSVNGGVLIEALQGDPDDFSSSGVSVLSSKAVAGAGAAKFGLAGAVAVTSNQMDATASLGAQASIYNGPITLRAINASEDSALASADARLGAGGSSATGVGIGIGVGVVVLDADAVADISGTAGTYAISDLAATVRSDHIANAQGSAGVAGGAVAIAPSVGLVVATDEALVTVQNGVDLDVSGRVRFEATSLLQSTVAADAAAKGATAALGLSFAMTMEHEAAAIVLERNVIAGGDIALETSQMADLYTWARASAAGVAQEAGSTTDTADEQIAGMGDFAARQGRTATPTAPSAESSDGSFGLGAAVALTLVGGASEVRVMPGVTLTARGGGVTLRALADTDAETTADGSTVVDSAATRPTVGIGAAVALTLAEQQTTASLQGTIFATGPVVIEAGMAIEDMGSDNNTLRTTAIAGAGAAKVGVAGSFALTLGNMDAVALVGPGAGVFSSDGGVSVLAASENVLEATATASAAMTGGSGVGIGAGVALVLADADATASLGFKAEINVAGAVTFAALSRSNVAGEAKAGAADGSVAIAPGFFLASGTGSALVLWEEGSDVISGSLQDLKAESLWTVVASAGSAASASSAALGLTAAIGIDGETAAIDLRRGASAGGDVTMLASQMSDVSLTAVASAKGVTQETTGTTGTTSNDQIADTLGFADGKRAPMGGGTTSAPQAQSSDGAFGLAAVLALSVVNGGADLRVAGTVASMGAISLAARSDVDSAVTADASVVKGSAATDPNVGVGAAVAINLAERTTRARVEGQLLAAGSVSVEAGMAADPDGRSMLSAKAVAGVGATKAAISGAFAMNLDRMSADASPGIAASLASQTDKIRLTARNVSGLSVLATANAALGTGGSGVGVGAAVGLNLVLGEATVGIAEGVGLAAKGLDVLAFSDHSAAGQTTAGATNGEVGVAPSVYITVNAARTTARLDSGTALDFGGDVSFVAQSVALTRGGSNSAGSGSSAGLGVSLSLAVQAEDVTASWDRAAKVAGNVKVQASQRTDVALTGVASASGVDAASSGTAADPKADKQMGKELGFANALGGTGGATSGSQPSAGSSKGAFGLAAAVAVSIVVGRLEARTGAPITALGSIEVSALQDVDSAVVADGSVVKGNAKTQPNVGVGAAVAINIASRTAQVTIGADLSAGTGVTVNSGMAPDAISVNRSVFVAKAVSGVGAQTTGVSGSFALNYVNLDQGPSLGAGIVLSGGEGAVSLLATSLTSAQAVASADAAVAGGGSKGTGVGAALAMNLMDSDAVVVLPGTVAVTGRGLVMTAKGDHIAAGEAVAGASGGATSVAPAVYLVASTAQAVARAEFGADLVLTGGLTMTAQVQTEITGAARSAAKGGSAAVGATVTLAVVEDSAVALLDRSITLGAAAVIRAVRVGHVALTSTASAAGESSASSGGKTSADQQVGQELGFLNAKGGTTSSAPAASASASDSGGNDKAVGIAAALSLAIAGGESRAEIAAGRVVVTPGQVVVEAQGDLDSAVTADGKSVDPALVKTGIGAAVAINWATNATTARVAGDVTAAGLTIRAIGATVEKPAVNTLLARAVAGAAGTDVGVAGAFAMNYVTLPSTAELTGTVRLGLTGNLAVTASVVTNISAIGTSKAIAATDQGSGGSSTSNSTSVGVGASFALNILNNDATATIGAGASVVGGNTVTLSALGSHDSVTRTVAGAGGNVGIAPSLALLISGNEAKAQTLGGSTLVLQGNYSATARQRHGATVDADASAKADKVAVGAAVSIAILPEAAVTSPGRSIEALGSITLSSDLATGVQSSALASTQGVTKKTGEASSSDDQVGGLLGFGDRKSGQTTSNPQAAKSGSDNGNSTSVGVAAALALNIVTGRSQSELASGLSLRAGGAVVLEARLDLDAGAVGDGSSSAQPTDGTSTPDYGIGVGVAINIVSGQGFARVHGDVVAGGAVTVNAVASAQGDGVNRLSALANAGAGGSKAGIAGAFAMNYSRIETQAVSDGSIRSGGVVTLQANAAHAATATASSKATIRAGQSNSNSNSSSVGVGASVAINLLDNDATAEVAGGLAPGAGLVIAANQEHQATTKTEAGASGDVAVSPSVALTISLNATTARLGGGLGLATTGRVAITATAEGIYATSADGAAGGKKTAVGAAIAVAVLTDKVEGYAGRDIASSAGAFQLRGWGRIETLTTATGSAAGNDQNSKDSDSNTNAAVNGNSAVTDRTGGTMDVPKGQDSVNQANGQTSSQAGGKTSSGVGVGAAIAVNAVITSAKATVADGVRIVAAGTGELTSALEVDARAEATGTAVDTSKTTNVAVGVSVNVVVADNLAHLGNGSQLITGGDLVIGATDRADRGDAVNTFVTRSLSAAGGDKTGVAGSLAVGVAVFTTRADLGTGSLVQSGGNLGLAASAAFEVQNFAGSAAYGGKTTVGASVAVNIAPIVTEALASGAVMDAAGAMTVLASTSYLPKTETLLPGVTLAVTSGALGGAVSDGNAAVAASVAVDVILLTTRAEIGDGVVVNGAGLAPKANQAVTVSALSRVTVNSATGGLGVASGDVGVGLGLTVGVISDTTRARIGASAQVSALGAVTVQADAAVARFSIAASFGLANSVGIAGSVLVDVLTSRTEASVGNDARLRAGSVAVRSVDADKVTQGAGAVGIGRTAGIGMSLSVLVHDDRVEALVGDRVQVTAAGSMNVEALSSEDLTTVLVSAAGGMTAGVSVTPAVSVLTEVTNARVGSASTIALRGEKLPASLVIRASDDTISFKVAGAAAFGGTAGVGVGVDTTVLTKTGSATLGAGAQAVVDGSVELRAKSTEDLTSLVITGAVAGTVAVNVSTGVIVSNVTTRARIEGTPSTSGRTLVDAGENVVVEAVGEGEYDLFAGGIAVGGTAGIGASVSVPVITKVTDAAIGQNASVTGRAQGRSSAVADGAVVSRLPGQDKTGTEVATDKAGPGFLQVGKDQAPPTDTNGTQGATSYEGNGAAAVATLLDSRSSQMRGVAVSAVNHDDLAQFSANGAAAGTVAIAIAGGVAVINQTSSGRIEAGAEINRPAVAGENARQDVVVIGANLYRGLTVAVAAAGAGSVAVSPTAGVVVLKQATDALILGGAVVEAQDSVLVNAWARQDVTSVEIGMAAATVGVGASVGVLSLTSDTRAHVGTIDGTKAEIGATVSALNDMTVRALNDTTFVGVQGGVAGGLVGVGASVGVAVVTKETSARIADGSVIDVAGKGGGVDGLVEFPVETRWGVSPQQGLSVQAGADETMTSVAFAGAGGYVGVGGAVTVAVIDSDTTARIGANARVNAAVKTEDQNVRVQALNRVKGTTFSGSLVGGAVGVGGTVVVGVAHNATRAEIGDGAVVQAGGEILVNALSAQEIRSLTAALTGAAVGVQLSAAIWVIGGDYAADGGSSSESEWLTKNQGAADGSGFGGFGRAIQTEAPGAFTGSRVNTLDGSITLAADRYRTGDAVVFTSVDPGRGSIGGLVSGKTYYIIETPKKGTYQLAATASDALAKKAITLTPTGQLAARFTLTRADTQRSDAALTAARSGVTAAAPSASLAGALVADPLSEGTSALVGGRAVLVGRAGITVQAEDYLDFRQLAGAFGVGGASFGASVSILVHDLPVLARVADGASLTASGYGVVVIAASTEDVSQMTFGGALAFASATGSVSVNVLHEVTHAEIGTGVVIRTTQAVGVEIRPDVLIQAADVSTVSDVAGAMGLGGAAGIGVGVDVVHLTKDNQALMGVGGAVATDGTLALRANATEKLGSLSVTGQLQGVAGVAGSASVLVVSALTSARMLGSDIAGGGAKVRARGNLVVEATDASEIDVLGGAVATGALSGVGAGVAVPVITRTTRAEIGANVDAVALGLAGTDSVTDFIIQAPPAPTGGALNLSLPQGGSTTPWTAPDRGASQVPGDQDGRQTVTAGDFATLAEALRFHNIAPGSSPAHSGTGVLVSAATAEDIAVYGLAGGISGGLTLGIAGAVTSVNDTTSARIGQARINQDGSTGGATQQVRVLAETDVLYTATAASVGASLGLSINPAAAVGMIGLNTLAEIGSGAQVTAQDGVLVRARANEMLATTDVSVAAGGIAGFAGSVAVVSFSSATKANIGLGAVVATPGSVRVEARDDTNLVGVTGSGALGGVAGLGGAVQVMGVTKSTLAQIDTRASVTAGGAVSQADAGTTATGIAQGALTQSGAERGVVVDAASTETVALVTLAGAGALLGGFGGAAGIVLLDSDTVARIGAEARVRATTGDVDVTATNVVKAFQFAGGAAIGGVALGGAVTIGILRNGTLAQVTGADVAAGGDIAVRALSVNDIRAFTASATGGLVAGAGSIALWQLGGFLDSSYGYQNQSTTTSDTTVTTSGTAQSSDALSGSGWVADHDRVLSGDDGTGQGYERMLNDRGSASDRTNVVNRAGYSSVAADGPDATVAGSYGPNFLGLEGTLAEVSSPLALVAGGALEVRAMDATRLTMVSGGVSAGGFAGGISVAIVNDRRLVSASLTGSATAGAVRVIADANADMGAIAIVGTGGLATLGAQVAVVRDQGSQVANVSDGVLTIGGASEVTASHTGRLVAQTQGVTQIAGVSAGVAVSYARDGSTTTARSTSGWSDAGAAAPANVAVMAVGRETISSEAWGSGMGLGASLNGAVAVAEGAGALSVTVSGVQALRGRIDATGDAQATVSAKAGGASGSLGLAVTAGVALARLVPSVVVTVDATGSSAGLGAKAVFNADPTTGAALAGLGASALAFGMSVSGLVAGGGSIALVEVTPTVTATNTGVSSLREARAYAGLAGAAKAMGLSVGGVAGIGASVAFSLVGGAVSATVGGSSAGGVTVEARTSVTSDAQAVAAAGGLLAGSINFAASQVTTATAASLTGTILTGLRSPVSVTSRMDGSSTAATKGVTVSLLGALQLGGSIATAGFGGSNTATSAANILAATSVDVAATGAVSAAATSGGSGGNVTVSALPIYGGVALATVSHAAMADLGGQVTSLREVRVRSDLTSSARSTASDKGLGFASFGLTRSYATNSAASTAQMRAGTVASGSLILVDAAGASYVQASGDAAGGGLLAAGTAVDVQARSTSAARANVLGGARLTATGTLTVSARNAAEGDGQANGRTVGLLFSGGATQGTLAVTTTSETTIAGGAVLNGGSVTITAEGGTVPSATTTSYAYAQSAADLAQDVIRITNHGLVSGQRIQLGTTGSAPWADAGRVYSVLTDATDPNVIRLGASFNAASGVDAANDILTFDGRHGFKTGDQVIYDRGTAASILVGAVPATLWVLVLDDNRIKLLDFDPTVAANWAARQTVFGSTAVDVANGRFVIAGHGLTTGMLVTYHAPQAYGFNSGQVDLQASGQAVAAGEESIYLAGHQFRTGDVVTYSVSGGPAIGGLVAGTSYKVLVLDANRIQLQTLAGATVALAPDTSAAGLKGSHALTPASGGIGGLVDGKTYRVSRIDANTFRLIDPASGLVVAPTTAGGASNSQWLVREGLDLRASSGASSVYIDMRGATLSGTLTGPGGVSLADAIFAQGDGRSRLLVDGFAAGAAGMTANAAQLTVSSNVRVLVTEGTAQAPTRITATKGAVTFATTNRWDAAVDARAGGAGIFAAGAAASRADISHTTLTQVGRTTYAGTAPGLFVTASGAVNATATEISRSAASATSIGGGAIAVASADATVVTKGTNTVTFGARAVVTAADITALASSSNAAASTMAVTVGGFGASASAGMGAGGTFVNPVSKTQNSGTFVEVGRAALLTATNAIDLAARIQSGLLESTARTDTGAAGGSSTARARTEQNESIAVTVRADAVLDGAAAVRLRANPSDNALSAKSAANLYAVVGASNSSAWVTSNLVSTVVGEAGSLVRTMGLTVDAGASGLGQRVLTPSTSRFDVPTHVGGTDPRRADNWQSLIAFDSNVRLLRNPAATITLAIDAAGVVTTARNARVEGGNGAGYNAGADGVITVDALGRSIDGTAVFTAATITGSAGVWTVEKGNAQVSITNLSAARLVLGDIDAVASPTSVAAPPVQINVANAAGFKFDIVTVYDMAPGTADDNRITVVSQGDVEIAGRINNPLGLVTIQAAGSILQGKAGQVTARAITLTAGQAIGDATGALVLKLVRADSRSPSLGMTAGTDIIARVSVAKRDLVPGAVTVDVPLLQAGGSVQLKLTDTVVEDVIPANHGGGIALDAISSVVNDATPGNAGPISTPAFYREAYFPDAAGPGQVSPDLRGVFGTASGFADAIWNLGTVAAGGGATMLATSVGGGKVTVTGPAAAPKAALPSGWVSGTALGAIDWSGMAA